MCIWTPLSCGAAFFCFMSDRLMLFFVMFHAWGHSPLPRVVCSCRCLTRVMRSSSSLPPVSCQFRFPFLDGSVAPLPSPHHFGFWSGTEMCPVTFSTTQFTFYLEWIKCLSVVFSSLFFLFFSFLFFYITLQDVCQPPSVMLRLYSQNSREGWCMRKRQCGGHR